MLLSNELVMQGMYDAIGRLASAAHANGDKIDENIRPESDARSEHGLDVFHCGQLVQFRTSAGEPRFATEMPFVFTPRLKNKYTPEDLSERADVNFSTLSAEQQEQVIDSMLTEELREIARYEEEFRTAVETEVCPTQADLLTVTYGSQELWNGMIIRDYMFPYDDSFSIEAYRQTLNRLHQIQGSIREIAHRKIPVLNGETSPEMHTTANDPSEIPGFQ